MKIKCPLCKDNYVYVKDIDGLEDHFYDEHGWEGGLTPEYAHLVFKIHETIAKLEKEPYHPLDVKQLEGKHWLKPEDMPKICFVCVGHQETIIELKSLLEDDK